jgi:hypothetical protein
VVVTASTRFVMSKRQEEWQQDISARQRNTVFPDTVENEGRLWRNLTSGKQKLTLLQGIGIALMFLTLGGIFWSEAVRRFTFGTSGSLSDRLVATLASFAPQAIILALFVVFFLILRWRVRRALLSGKHTDHR